MLTVKINFNSKTGIIFCDKNEKIIGSNSKILEILGKKDLFDSNMKDIFLFLEKKNYTVEKSSFYFEKKDIFVYLILDNNNQTEDEADFYRSILEASHDEIYVSDENGMTLYCNKAFERHYEISRSEIVGRYAWHIMEAGYADTSPIPIVIKTKEELTLEQHTRTGRKILITACPVFDDNKNLKMVVENCRDITEIENMKTTLEQTKKEIQKYKSEIQNLRKKTVISTKDVIFNSQKMKNIISMVDRVSSIDATMLILGESGTGKSHLAKYIHNQSKRRNGPFITINCTTISPSLLESELFGYESGAFTGAKKEGKIGLVELADGGTLFLDEIGEIPIGLQAKFLELLQEKKFTPVGGVKSKIVDVRIISATNQDLLSQVKKKIFREDLYYRLKVVDIMMPPLRERKDDLKSLIEHFLYRYCTEYSMDKLLSSAALEVLYSYSWPGNIRELQNVVLQAVITSPHKEITTLDLPSYIYNSTDNASITSFLEEVSLEDAIEKVEKSLILRAYDALGSSYKVAEALKISQSKAHRLINKYKENDLSI